ncbi:hypothetical protein [Bacillus manliponensis]|uniref:DUF6843 domain-containing protein n=1 Tax=Bacillus manliponensis TaxID=574376 RepID=UPI0035179995
MHKKITAFILLIIGVSVVGIVLLICNSDKPGTDEIYLIPDGYTGCVSIFYDVKNASPLEIKDKVITYKIPEDGILRASSNETFGWGQKEHSGWHETKYYYVDREGNKVRKLIEYEDIHSIGNTGDSFKDEDGTINDVSYHKFFIGTEEEAEKSGSCSKVYTEDLLREIYYR